MIWLAALLASAGWIVLERRKPWPVGAAALAAAFAASVAAWGWAVGPVAWVGVLSATALPLVFARPYVSRSDGHRRSSRPKVSG